MDEKQLTNALLDIAAALEGGDYPSGHDDIFMSSALSSLTPEQLQAIALGLRGLRRVDRSHFGRELLTTAAALTHYSQTIAQAEALAARGDGSALVAMFTERDGGEDGVLVWHEGDDLVEATYGVNGKAHERINGVMQ